MKVLVQVQAEAMASWWLLGAYLCALTRSNGAHGRSQLIHALARRKLEDHDLTKLIHDIVSCIVDTLVVHPDEVCDVEGMI